MRIILAMSLVSLVVGAGVAQADTYISVGVGSDAILGGDLDAFRTDDSTSGRLGLGFRTGGFAIEAVGFGTGLQPASGVAAGGSGARSLSLGVDLKYHVAILLGLEGYGRAGLHKSWLNASKADPNASDFEGSGSVFGLGLAYCFPTPVISASVWLDYGHQTVDLRDAVERTMSGTVDMVLIGVSVGI
ncbi:outer membrane beta-barrel protein [Haliangium sp.]|uniref:outer membrane beta-barrel protein n=1 Tax=Haliangium sp. TaxID=2663208 RepID=UPI003D0B7F83